MNKAVRALAAGATLAALTLTGCAGSPSDAAIVNGVSVPDQTVRQVAESIVDVSGAQTGVALKQATYDLMLGEASRQIAASTGTTVDAAARATVLAQNQVATNVAATEQGRPWGDAVSTTYVLLEELGEERYLEELNKLAITVNPRYGQWDASRVTFSDASLSRLDDLTGRRR